jgi:RHS repeat-associated protein
MPYPIQVPPGRLSMTPSLGLSYSSNQAKSGGIAGAGWTFHVPQISRETGEGLRLDPGPTYRTDRLDSPSGRIVRADSVPSSILGPPVPSTSSIFVPEREQEPVRYEHIEGEDRWVEHRPSGNKRYFGAIAGQPSSRIENELGTYAWLLVREQDAFGNTIDYEYHSQPGANGLSAVPIVKSIRWGAHPNSGIAHQFEVRTEIESSGQREIDMLQGRVELRSRVRDIIVGTAFAGQEYWRYHLNYTSSRDSGRSLLMNIVRSAPGETDQTTSFSYSNNDAIAGSSFFAAAQDLPQGVYNDLKYIQESPIPFSNASEARQNARSPKGFRSGYRWLDYDADGDPDVVYHPAGLAGSGSRIQVDSSFERSTAGLSGWTSSDLHEVPENVELVALTNFDRDGDLDGIGFGAREVRGYQRAGSNGGSDPAGIVSRPTAAVGQGIPGEYVCETNVVCDEMCTDTNYLQNCQVVDPPDFLANQSGYPGGPFEWRQEWGTPFDDTGWTGGPGWQPPFTNPVVGPDGFQYDEDMPPRPFCGCMPMCVDNTCTLRPIEQPPLEAEDAELGYPADGPDAWFTLNQSIPGGTTGHRRLIFRNWPEKVREHYEVLFTGSTAAVAYPITAFNTMTGDLDADGRDDIALGKFKFYLKSSLMQNSTLTTFTPRAYLTRGEHVISDMAGPYLPGEEPNTTFTESMLEALAPTVADDCSEEIQCLFDSMKNTRDYALLENCLESISQCINQAKYPGGVDFNAMILDINGDRLADLVAAEPPSEGARRQCLEGHRVYFNVGDRFDVWSTSTTRLVPDESWSSSGGNAPFSQLRNRNNYCPGGPQHPVLDAETTPLSNLPVGASTFSDLNADGRLDLIFAYLDPTSGQRVQRIYFGNGTGFQAPSAVFAPNYYVGWGALPSTLTFTQLKVFDIAPAPRHLIEGWSDMSRLADVDGDGLTDLVHMGYCDAIRANGCTPASWQRNISVHPDFLTSVSETSGSWTSIDYVWSGSPTAKSANIVASAHLRPRNVVSAIRSAAGPSPDYPTQTVSLNYTDQRITSESHEDLGFERVTAIYQNSFAGTNREQLRVTQHFDVRRDVTEQPLAIEHPLRGHPTLIEEEGSGTIRRLRPTWLVSPLGASAVSIRAGYEELEECAGANCRTTGARNTDFDDFGFVTGRIEGQIQAGFFVLSSARRTTSKISNNLTLWILGRQSVQTVFGRTKDISGTVTPNARLEEWAWSYVGPELRLETRVDIAAPHCDAGPANDITEAEYLPSGQLEKLTRGARVVEIGYDPAQLYATETTAEVSTYLDGQSVGSNKLATFTEVDLRTGQRTLQTHPNGQTWEWVHDSTGRLRASYGPGHTQLNSIIYSDAYPSYAEETVYLNASQSLTRRLHLDGDGNLLAAIESGSGQKIRRKLERRDAFGRIVESYAPSTASGMDDLLPGSAPMTASRYDAFDRKLQDDLPGNRRHIWTHSPGSETELNPRNYLSSRTYDWSNKLTRVSYHNGPTTQSAIVARYSYYLDGLGRLLTIEDPEQRIRDFARDGAGRISETTLPHPSNASPAPFRFCYDHLDQPRSVSTPAGRTTEIFRDELGRPIESTAKHGNSRVSAYQSYDATTDGLGQLTRVLDHTGAFEFGYDTFGRRATIQGQLDPSMLAGLPNFPETYTAETVYGRQGQLISQSMSGVGALGTVDLGALTYAHDDFGRPISLDSRVLNNTTRLAGAAVYAVDDQLATITLGNSINATWTFDPARRHITAIEYRVNNSRLARVSYPQIDANGNILREERLRGASATIVVRKRHTYDALDRLSWTELLTPAGTQASTNVYSASGNLLDSGVDKYLYEDPLHVQAATSQASASGERHFVYDDDGWLESESTSLTGGGSEDRTLQYDGAGCLAQVATKRLNGLGQTVADRVTTHACGLGGQRIRRETYDLLSGRKARTLEIPGIGEIRADEGIFLRRPTINRNVTIEEAIDLSSGVRIDSESGYVLEDMRGSVLARTQFTAPLSTMVREGDYDAWGASKSIGALPLPRHGFVGEEADPGDGYVHLGARVYDPTMRRWLSPDPLLLTRPEIDTADTRQLNLYSYAANNPVIRTDRGGMFALPVVVGAIILGVVGFQSCEQADISNAMAGAGDFIDAGIDAVRAVDDPTLANIVVAGIALGMVIVPGDQPNVADDIAGTKVGRGGAGNVQKGKEGVELTAAKTKDFGHSTIANEITVQTTSGKKTRADEISVDANGDYHGTESKNGPTAKLNKNQRETIPEIQEKGGKMVGPKAEKEGLDGKIIKPGNFRIDWWNRKDE